MEIQSRRGRLNHGVDENAHSLKGKVTVSHPKGITVRGVLGEVNANADVRREFVGKAVKKAENVNEESEKKTQKPILRRNYNHVQPKIDTGLSGKPFQSVSKPTSHFIQPSSRPPLRREESTGGLATRALLTRAAAKENVKKEELKEILNDSKKPVKVIKKQLKLNIIKESVKEKKPVKETTDCLERLQISEVDARFFNLEPPKLPDDIEDIDAGDDNPLLMSDYIKDIYNYLTYLENAHPIEENYLKKQSFINGNMRATLIDWLVEIQIQFRLLLETFQMTVWIIDRYLQAVPNVPKEKLQLIGVASMFIASKYEEIYAPDIADFVFITDNAFSKREILKYEKEIISKLNFCFARPIPLTFLRRFLKAAHGTSTNHQLAKFFVDQCLVEYSMCHYRPSELAAAALCISLHVLGKPLDTAWSPTLAYYSGYSLADIKPIMKKIARIVIDLEKSRYQSVFNKYAGQSQGRVSVLPQVRGIAMQKLAES